MKGIYKVNDVMRSNGLDAWKYCSDAEKLDYLGEMGWANLSNWEELEESIRIMGEKVAWLEKENPSYGYGEIDYAPSKFQFFFGNQQAFFIMVRVFLLIAILVRVW